MESKNKKKKSDNLIEKELLGLSSKFSKNDTLVIILAAGHGKRIRSSTSKMLHTIWGICLPLGMFLDYFMTQGAFAYWQSMVLGAATSAVLLFFRLRYIEKRFI